MFRDRLVHWAGVLNVFTCAMGAALLKLKVMQANVKADFGRSWESSTQERNFERNLAVRQAYNHLQSQLPVAR